MTISLPFEKPQFIIFQTKATAQNVLSLPRPILTYFNNNYPKKEIISLSKNKFEMLCEHLRKFITSSIFRTIVFSFPENAKKVNQKILKKKLLKEPSSLKEHSSFHGKSSFVLLICKFSFQKSKNYQISTLLFSSSP